MNDKAKFTQSQQGGKAKLAASMPARAMYIAHYRQ